MRVELLQQENALRVGNGNHPSLQRETNKSDNADADLLVETRSDEIVPVPQYDNKRDAKCNY